MLRCKQSWALRKQFRKFRIFHKLQHCIGNAVTKQSENLPAVVTKSLDEWVERTRGKVTPNCFSSLYREASIHVFKKCNNTVSSSAAVKRVFSVGSNVLPSKRASLTAENFERFVLLQENEKCLPQSSFLRK